MDSLPEAERKTSEKLLNRECDNLLNEIQRLVSELSMQEKRLKNVMALVSYITKFVRQTYSQFWL